MKFIPTELPGVILIEPDVFKDARGFFLETYHERKYAEGGIAGAILLCVLLLDGRIRQIVDRRIRARRYAVHEHGPAQPAETTKARALEVGQ